MDGYLASGFRAVDAGGAVDRMQHCLRLLDGLPSVQGYKAELARRLGTAPGMTALDVGCGLGFDTRRLADVVGPTGRAVGLDPSIALLAAARQKASDIGWVMGSGANLPFGDKTFDVARVDRTLQHVADPARVIGEMHRVLKVGGRIGCAEPDWGTFVLTSTDHALTRRAVETWSDSFASGWVGRWLAPMLADAGFADIELSGHLLTAESFASADAVFDLALTADRLRSEVDVDAWLAGLRAGPCHASVTVFLLTATTRA